MTRRREQGKEVENGAEDHGVGFCEGSSGLLLFCPFCFRIFGLDIAPTLHEVAL